MVLLVFLCGSGLYWCWSEVVGLKYYVWSLIYIQSVTLVRRGLFEETFFLEGSLLGGICGAFYEILILFAPLLKGLVVTPLSIGLGIRSVLSLVIPSPK